MVASWLIAAVAIVPIIIFKILFINKIEGWLGILLKVGVGLGAAVGAVAVSSFCPALGFFMIVVAIILGELFGVIALYVGPMIPWIGQSIAPVIEPISGTLMIFLILNIILFVLHILKILAIVPIVGTIVLILGIVIPLVIIWLIWGKYVDAFSGLTSCFGGGSGRIAIPGTGGISIGT